jgi:hypothetical protein
MATRKEAESLWAGTVLTQPILWIGPVKKSKQAEDERIAMREAGIQLAAQLIDLRESAPVERN